MKRVFWFCGLLGLALVIALVVWQGYAQVLAAFAQAGWGILWASLYHIVPLMVSSWAWVLLWPGRRRPSFGFMCLVQWIRSAVNNLLPVARIGGELVAVRLMTGHGWRRAPAIAGTVVETTVSVVTVFILVMTGIILLALRAPGADVLDRLLLGALAVLPVILALLAVQRLGIFRLLARLTVLLAGGKWRHLLGRTLLLDRAVRGMYRRAGRIAACGAWMLLSWYLGAGQIWLSLYFLGNPLPVADCIIIEAMIQLAASVAFVVPAALGAQEGAFLFFGGLLGLPPQTALALALMRRCRDILIYVPALLVWQGIEGKWLAARKPEMMGS